MKNILLCSAILASSTAFANFSAPGIVTETSYEIHTSPGAKGGVDSADYKFWTLTPKEMQKKKAVSGGDWITVQAIPAASTARIGTAAIVTATHQACFTNSLGTAVDAGYRFTLQAVGQNTTLSNKMALHGGKGVCITLHTYLIVNPPATGQYDITAFSHADMWYSVTDTQANAILNVQ